MSREKALSVVLRSSIRRPMVHFRMDRGETLPHLISSPLFFWLQFLSGYHVTWPLKAPPFHFRWAVWFTGHDSGSSALLDVANIFSSQE
ncbi:hypothetical protein EGR_04952 [Echinococcus granulosus]|uniref:Uncharacterized protein n=1 Tax=Echinococcus granulosus TaxID=6210 RepID=W6UPP1_ECHGR|nr:hypothetical protein EGR_04952 [Echinococcus granulosus]EUB60242.1 hypothetical protein EGR_04952 [Echinococcus granulosus]